MRRTFTLILAVVLAAGFFSFESSHAQDDIQVRVVTVDSLAATPGMAINFIANGFPGDTTVVAGMGPVGSEYEVQTSITTGPRGVAFGQVTVPQTALQDQSWVVVIATSDNAIQAVSYPITILEPLESASVPDLFIVPRVGEPGTEVQIRGINYPANADVLVGVGRQLSDFAFSFEVTTDDNGTFSDTFTIPETATPGTSWIALAELESNRDFEAISGTFSVIGEPEPLVFDDEGVISTDMYFIALGDGGRSGIEIGCNDSAIPVELVFDEPTVTPISQAIETMLALDGQIYGRTGLYHAIYPSELTLEGITIEDGLATINLSGGLAVGGECDEPRIQAQIALTALQYNNVDDVLILINGIPYEELVNQ